MDTLVKDSSVFSVRMSLYHIMYLRRMWMSQRWDRSIETINEILLYCDWWCNNIVNYIILCENWIIIYYSLLLHLIIYVFLLYCVCIKYTENKLRFEWHWLLVANLCKKLVSKMFMILSKKIKTYIRTRKTEYKNTRQFKREHYT